MPTKRKTVIIHRALNGANTLSFTENFDLDFQPSEVIIRDISFVGDLDELHGIRASWTDAREGLIGTFIADPAFTSQPSSFFTIKERSLQNGSHTFEIYTLTNTLGTPSAVGNLAMTLEFTHKIPEPYEPKMNDLRPLMTAIWKDIRDTYPFGLPIGMVGGRDAVDEGTPEKLCYSNVDRTLTDPEMPPPEEPKTEEKKEEEK